MYHAATQHFQPARVTAHTATVTGTHHTLDIDLGRWLGKRKIRRPESHGQIFLFEKGTQEFIDQSLQAGKAGMLIDQQTLHLVKHRRMRQIGITAVNAARGNNPQRWFTLLHHPDLYR